MGYIGVMGSADGVEHLLHAAHHLIREKGRDDIQFLLMGSGPELDALRQLRDELGLTQQVTMPGRVSDAFLCSALQTMDLGVACDPINAYNDHCTMNKVLEYMAFAKPMVMFGTVAATGVRILSKVDFTHSRYNLYIVAVSIGIGLIPHAAPRWTLHMPPALHPLLESGILLSALTAIVLNVFFHGGKEDRTATLEAAKATDSH